MYQGFDTLEAFTAALHHACAMDGGHPPLPERVVRVRLLCEPTPLAPVQLLSLQAAITVWHPRAGDPVPGRLELHADCGPVLTCPGGASRAEERARVLLQRLELVATACGLALRPW